MYRHRYAVVGQIAECLETGGMHVFPHEALGKADLGRIGWASVTCR
jgi:hypothetical protein